MSQKLIFGFPIPVVLAFIVLVLALLAVARVLVAMRKPAPIRLPSGQAGGRIEDYAPDDETIFRLGRLEIAPIAERTPHHR